MEPAWNLAKIAQVVGRAVRYKSHDIPGSTVIIYKYYCYKPKSYFNFPLQQSRKKKENLSMSADIYLKQISEKKDKVNQKFLQYVNQWSIENAPLGSCTEEQL
jgi:hypothetical protein